MGGVWLPGRIVHINQRKLKNRWWQSTVSASRPIANILIALLLSGFFQTLTKNVVITDNKISEDLFLSVGIAFVIYLQVFTAIFNLLPIPGLDGYDILDPWLPKHIKSKFNYLKKYNTLIILGLLWWGAFAFKLIEMIISETLKVPGTFIEAGLFSFQQTVYVVFSFVVFMVVIWGCDLNYQGNLIEKCEESVKRTANVTNRSYPETYSNSSPRENTVKEKVNFASQVDPETRKRAIALASYDKERIERLLKGVRLKNPDRSEQWYWEKILYDMERDRGF